MVVNILTFHVKDEWKDYVINFQFFKQHYFELKLVKAIKD